MSDFSHIFTDKYGKINQKSSDFLVGIDNPLLRISQFCSEKRKFQNLMPDDIDINMVIQSGLFGRMHLVNVLDDNPENYFFEHYGGGSKFERGESFQNRKISEAQWSALRQFAISDYNRIKNNRSTDLVQVQVESPHHGLSTIYRRLVLPMFSSRHGGHVTHLLVSIRPNCQGLVSHAAD
jgi:hypothetical protein